MLAFIHIDIYIYVHAFVVIFSLVHYLSYSYILMIKKTCLPACFLLFVWFGWLLLFEKQLLHSNVPGCAQYKYVLVPWHVVSTCFLHAQTNR